MALFFSLIFLAALELYHGFSPIHSSFWRFSSIKFPVEVLKRALSHDIDLHSTSKKLPVTIISGFLGAGKTTLLNNILTTDHEGVKYAVIVNDMSEMNIDEKLVQSQIRYKEEKLVQMSNGCICCTLREDLLQEVAILANERKFDHLIIEGTGIAEPLPIAETFTFRPENGTGSLMDVAEIKNMITVIDASSFIRELKRAEDLSTRGLQAGPDDVRTITDLIVSQVPVVLNLRRVGMLQFKNIHPPVTRDFLGEPTQVEFASILILNKCDLVTPEQMKLLRQAIRCLNAEAALIEASHCRVNISDVIGIPRFDFEKVAQSPAWLKAINSEHEKIPETEEYGISSFVFRAPRPFHPERLLAFIEEEFEAGGEEGNGDDQEDSDLDDGSYKSGAPVVLRSKGFFWLASRPEQQLIWAHAGGLFHITSGGRWWADIPRERWVEYLQGDQEAAEEIERDWVSPYGDRRQELVFIGVNLDEGRLKERLRSCLLTPEEEGVGMEAWGDHFIDPFPPTPEEDEETGAIGSGVGDDEDEGEEGGEWEMVAATSPRNGSIRLDPSSKVLSQ